MEKLEPVKPKKNRFSVTDECNLFLWYLRKFPWMTLEQIETHFYSNISKTNGYIIKRINFLVKMGLIDKWKTPHLHYSITPSGLNHLEYWLQKIRKYESPYLKSIQAHNYSIEYIKPNTSEPRFQDYTHSNYVIETALTFSKYGKFEIVEALDFVLNKKESLFIRNFPDILMLNFEEKIVLRYVLEIENSPITLDKLVSKLVRNFKDSEGRSDLVKNLRNIEQKPIATFHLFYCTSIQMFNYYIKSIRQIMGTCFDKSMSEDAWKRKWTSLYKIDKWEEKLKFNSSEFIRWLQSGRLFFGIYPENLDFKNTEMVTYDNLKNFGDYPVPQGAGTDKNIKLFDSMKNF